MPPAFQEPRNNSLRGVGVVLSQTRTLRLAWHGDSIESSHLPPRFCTLMAPVFELLAEKFHQKYGNQVRFALLDVQQFPDFANVFEISGLPGFRVIRDGGAYPGVIMGADTPGLEKLVSDSCQGLAESGPASGAGSSAPLITPGGAQQQAFDVSNWAGSGRHRKDPQNPHIFPNSFSPCPISCCLSVGM